MTSMYRRNPPTQSSPRPTIYNSPPKLNENKTKEKTTESQEITFLREAHVTEITLGNQTLRVMDAGHIQGVINMMEKQDSNIKQLQKTVNTQNRNIQAMHQQMQSMKRELDEIKGKLNGNFL